MDKRTCLYQAHHDMGARLVPFGGWEMPLHYGSQLEEHHAVRRKAGMFDVSHMTVVDLKGEQVKAFLRKLLANDVARLKTPGKALYSCMLNDSGGVIDDLIIYYMNDTWYRMVVNAGTTEKDVAWLQKQAPAFGVNVSPEYDLAMVAVQGPEARELALPLIPEKMREQVAELKPFSAAGGGDWFVGRTGYTGEDGFEVMLPESAATEFWNGLAHSGVQPCGLGARDTLRLEAGMNLYGSDMDEEIIPLEAGLNWTIAWEPEERGFIGRSVLDARRGSPENRKFIGLVLTGRGVLRNHQKVFFEGLEVGEITSGGFAPTLQKAIAMARVEASVGDQVEVDIRGKKVAAKVVNPPFVRNGAVQVEVD